MTGVGYQVFTADTGPGAPPHQQPLQTLQTPLCGVLIHSSRCSLKIYIFYLILWGNRNIISIVAKGFAKSCPVYQV